MCLQMLLTHNFRLVSNQQWQVCSRRERFGCNFLFLFIFTCRGQLRHFLLTFNIMKTEDDLSTVQITNTAKSNFAMGRTELLADSWTFQVCVFALISICYRLIIRVATKCLLFLSFFKKNLKENKFLFRVVYFQNWQFINIYDVVTVSSSGCNWGCSFLYGC